MAFDTAGNIINDVAVEVGLAAVADPFASTDPNFIQLRGLLKRVGRKLVSAKQWTHLQASYSLTTVQGQAYYPLPTDFQAMINQSQWNRTNRLPLAGPLSPQEWQYLKGRSTGIVFTVLFRPAQGQLTLYPDTGTPGGQVIAFEYISSWWVNPVATNQWVAAQFVPVGSIVTTLFNGVYRKYICTKAGTTDPSLPPTATTPGVVDGTVVWNYVYAGVTDAPTLSTDTISLERVLMVDALKVAWLRAKGFDSTAAEEDYESSLAEAMDNDSSAEKLHVGGGGSDGPLLGLQSIPLTGFGS